MSNTVSAFRLINSIVVMVRDGHHERLECLDVGSILIPTSDADDAGIVDAIWKGIPVSVFRRDLEEGCDRIEMIASEVRKGSPDHRRNAVRAEQQVA